VTLEVTGVTTAGKISPHNAGGSMSLTVQPETGDIHVMKISGLLRKSEVDAVQGAAAKMFETVEKVELLVVAENFQGWESGTGWGDLSFFLKYGDRVEKIAIVAEEKWKDQFLAFFGAGFRKAPVKFFPASQLAEAKSWLA
jgi:hypothetical protein